MPGVELDNRALFAFAVLSFFYFNIYIITLANKVNSTHHRLNFDNHCGGGEAEGRIAPLSGDQTVKSLAVLQEKLVIVERKLLLT